ncbi:MAG TPA: M20/M25/M40 family metallo-hydrolase, partial [Anaerolineae bacterium]|nr:M20/M25/M40 family metallo-hydrolase [Anaerolineae bacterium]
MQHDVIKLTSDLIRIKSVSRWSNRPIADYLEKILQAMGCTIERSEVLDDNGEYKVNLIGKLGSGTGGLAFCSHMDTVPGQEQDWEAFEPTVRAGKLYGRGSCDMKGPIAATLIAAASVDVAKLKKPLYIILTADEEVGLLGA